MQSRKQNRWGPWLILPALLLGVVAVSTSAPVLGQDAPPPPPAPAQGQEPQVLTRGPIHEGFAEPVNFNPKPGLVAPKEPPQAIEEVPPDEKPTGNNVSWLGGYWNWDDERKDYIWVSGFWRVLPPGRKWYPGYWNKVDTGYQWTAGYWGNAQQAEVEYLPPPPDSQEQGPVTEAPSADHIWVPGCWVYRSRYLWRPGYWVVAQPGWVWYPSHYTYSPTGYIYVDGYWDYAFARRGVLFAPVYYDPWWHRPHAYVYRPSIVLDIGLVSTHFFCRPHYHHYYFGDYYASTYVGIGITPWFNFHYSRGHYCPHYAYSRWHHRHSPGWEASVRVDFGYRRDHIAARPPRTYIQQQNIVNNTTIINNKTVINNNVTKIDPRYRNQLAMGQTLGAASKKASENKDAPLKFEKVTPQQSAQFKQEAQTVRASMKERQTIEREARAKLPKGGSAPTEPFKLTGPKSGIASKPLPDAGGTRSNLPGGAGGNVGGKPPFTKGDDRPGSGGGKPPVTKQGDDRPGLGGGKPPITRPGDNQGGDLKRPGGNQPPTGGGGKPPVVPPTGGADKPPTGGGGKPPAVPPRGGGADKPPTGGGGKPPIVPPSGGGNKPPSGTGNKPPREMFDDGMSSRPPVKPLGGGGGNNKPPMSPPSGGGDRGGYTPPPSGGGNRGGGYTPPSGGGRNNTPPPSGGGGNKGGGFTPPPSGGGRNNPPPPSSGGNKGSGSNKNKEQGGKNKG